MSPEKDRDKLVRALGVFSKGLVGGGGGEGAGREEHSGQQMNMRCHWDVQRGG